MRVKLFNDTWENTEWTIEFVIDVPESPLHSFYIQDVHHNFLTAHNDCEHVFMVDQHKEPDLEQWEWEWWTKDTQTSCVRSVHGTWLMFDPSTQTFRQTEDIHEHTLKITEM